jgi:hypothetical protein
MKSEVLLSGPWLWTCTWQSTVLIVLGLIGSYILKHRSSRAHQVVLLSTAAAVIVPAASMFIKHYELGVFTIEPTVMHSLNEGRVPINNHQASETVSTESVKTQSVSEEETTAPVIARSHEAKFPWRSMALYGWIAASAILAVRLLVTFILGARLLNRAGPFEL